jgi:tRNA-specific 2-thiouridylase
LAIKKISGERAIWCGPAAPPEKSRGFVQVRAHGEAHPCTYWSEGSESNLIAELDDPIFGLATGQAMVIYEGDRVVGSATIAGTE